MGLPQPQSPSPPHLYPQAIQLKLYQAFIFSIPILFSIILFLLFYLFYLKRRASSFSQPHQPILPTSLNRPNPFVPSNLQLGLKGELKIKLPSILFDEELKARDSQCCVCLGEFELKEELLQIPFCDHVFHGDCIKHWLHSNLTCPLCRTSVLPITTTILQNPESTERSHDYGNTNNSTPSALDDDQLLELVSFDAPQRQQASSSSSNTVFRDTTHESMLIT